MDQRKARLEATSQLKHRVDGLEITATFADEVVSQCTFVNYDEGSMLFIQGSPADILFYVFSGWVKTYCPLAGGTRILMNVAGPGDLIGYADFTDSRGHRAQVFEAEALTKISVALFTRNNILRLLQSLDQKTSSHLIERVNTAWSSIAYRFGSFLGMSLKERLEFVLKELGAKFGVRDSRGILLKPELTQFDFADMIGSSRPMVTRLMSQMIDERTLLRQGRQIILLNSLADQASEPGQASRTHMTNGASRQ
jgi:CRP/FNR family cyclic AMP-dependent transcriptional regulator